MARAPAMCGQVVDAREAPVVSRGKEEDDGVQHG
jgi:hypothetical protein